MRFLQIKIAASIGLLLSAAPARASLYEYRYQGTGFDVFQPGATNPSLTSHDFVSFALFTDSRLAPLTTYQTVSATTGTSPSSLLSWQVSDGLDVLSSLTGPFSGGGGGLFYDTYVTTNAVGQIASWQLIVQQAANPATDQPGVVIESCGPIPCLYSIGVSGSYAGEYVQIDPSQGGKYLYSAISNTPGRWTSTQLVPEPSNLAFLIPSAAFMIALSRRQKQPAR